MADKGVKITDKLLKQTEKKISAIYDEAQKEAQKKADSFFAKFADEDKRRAQLVQDGKLSKAEYEHWRKGKMLAGTRYKAMAESLATDMTNSNRIAASVINGHLPDVYAANYNWSTYDIEQKANINTSFVIYDRQTVERLIREDPDLLPMRAGIDIPKDLQWNKQKINGAITQGILLGESIPDISKRLMGVTDMNRKAAIRNARTMTTSAQNAGRLDSYKRAQDMGIKIEQEWLASPDDRTRYQHRLLHHQKRAIGKPFTVEGYELMFPGDPAAEAFLVYNCRCTTVSVFQGFDHKKMDDYVGNTPMTYYDWETSHMKDKAADVQTKIDKSQKKLDKMSQDELVGVWKNPVTTADYPDKKDKIQAKRDYFNEQLAKYPEGSPEHEKFKKLLEELDEYEKQGMKFEKELAKQDKLKAELSGINAELKARGAIKEPERFGAELYTPEAKKAALNFTDRNDADKHHRAVLDVQWATMSESEKWSVWQYTENSNPMNKSLSGYHETWYRHDFIGPLNTDWGHEDSWRTIHNPAFTQFSVNGHVSYFNAIRDLTTAIEKCEMPESCWLVRGSDKNGLAGMIEGLLSFDDAKDLLDNGTDSDIKAALIGQCFRNEAFTSTGIATDAGFDGVVSYKIFAPKGTKAIYAEPQSNFGSTASSTVYKPGMHYNYVGDEAEVILQRGTTFRVANVSKSGGSVEIELEIVDQPNYFVTGAENTADNGATSHTK